MKEKIDRELLKKVSEKINCNLPELLTLFQLPEYNEDLVKFIKLYKENKENIIERGVIISCIESLDLYFHEILY